jgi:hypothetical protein
MEVVIKRRMELQAEKKQLQSRRKETRKKEEADLSRSCRDLYEAWIKEDRQ